MEEGANSCEGVIHLAFDNDFSRYAEANADDLAAVNAIGAVLEGTNKPFVVTSAVLSFFVLGRTVTENDILPSDQPRMAAENAVIALADKGVRSSAVRLAACVHDTVQFGFASLLVGVAKEKKTSAYLNNGDNSWLAVHRQDAADLYVRALEFAKAGTRLHAVSKDGVSVKAIAEAIGSSLNLPVESLTATDAIAYRGLGKKPCLFLGFSVRQFAFLIWHKHMERRRGCNFRYSARSTGWDRVSTPSRTRKKIPRASLPR